MKLPILCAAIACVSLPAYSLPAYAHVTANPDSGKAGAYFQTSFRISHGCEGSATTSVKVTLPSGTLILKPQAKPGWKVTVTKRKLGKSVPAGHGKMAQEEFVDVTWSGGNLPDDQYDEFGILTKLPEHGNQTLWFPVTQVCEKGEMSWSEIPDDVSKWHDLKHPAPFVRVMDESSDAHTMHISH